jgi:selenocysteine-specific elongation factor
VDHGKTALVALLTGTDTDRWEEEKRRGITIDLGFARLDLTDGLTASIVDVPGHEDFVRNMVAGATGVDVALLVVAADEGVMPQTTEHLAILDFLGVRTGVVSITKVDLVEREWLELVEADIAERLGASAIVWEPMVRTSTVTGVGEGDLVAALARAAGRAIDRSDDDLFRMPVDRVFSVAGAGTVVTGTTWSGAVAVGDPVMVLPGGRSSRVRSVEVHGEPRDRAAPGRRTALALPGVGRGDVARGSVVVAGAGWKESTAIDVWMRLLPDSRPLTQRSRVRLHLGTAEVLARLTPAGDTVEPGAAGAVRLRLERPIVTRWGDRGVIRSYSPVRTIGGCVVVDPMPAPRPRRPRNAERKGAAAPLERLEVFMEDGGTQGLRRDDLPVRLGVHLGEVGRLVAQARDTLGVRVVGERLLAAAVLEEAERTVVALLERHHHDRPLEPGASLEDVRTALRDAELADAAVATLASAGTVVLEGSSVRRQGFQPALSPEDERLATVLRTALVEAGPLGLTEAELGQHVPAVRARELAEFDERAGRVVRVGRDRYYDIESLDRLRGIIVGLIGQRGRATPAEIREVTGLTRKYLIPVLEWMDAFGFTVRDGDSRKLGPAAQWRERNS